MLLLLLLRAEFDSSDCSEEWIKLAHCLATARRKVSFEYWVYARLCNLLCWDWFACCNEHIISLNFNAVCYKQRPSFLCCSLPTLNLRNSQKRFSVRFWDLIIKAFHLFSTVSKDITTEKPARFAICSGRTDDIQHRWQITCKYFLHQPYKRAHDVWRSLVFIFVGIHFKISLCQANKKHTVNIARFADVAVDRI